MGTVAQAIAAVDAMSRKTDEIKSSGDLSSGLVTAAPSKRTTHNGEQSDSEKVRQWVQTQYGAVFVTVA